MSNINADNLAGLLAVAAIPVRLVTSWPLMSSDSTKLLSAIGFTSGVDWVDIPIMVYGTAKYGEQSKDVDGDIFWETRFEMALLTGENPTAFIMGDLRQRYILRLTLNNGTVKVYGSVANPVQIMEDYATGKIPGEAHSSVLASNSRQPHKALIYTF